MRVQGTHGPQSCSFMFILSSDAVYCCRSPNYDQQRKVEIANQWRVCRVCMKAWPSKEASEWFDLWRYCGFGPHVSTPFHPFLIKTFLISVNQPSSFLLHSNPGGISISFWDRPLGYDFGMSPIHWNLRLPTFEQLCAGHGALCLRSGVQEASQVPRLWQKPEIPGYSLYLSANLGRLKFAQVILSGFFVLSGHMPASLDRLTTNSWPIHLPFTLADIQYLSFNNGVTIFHASCPLDHLMSIPLNLPRAKPYGIWFLPNAINPICLQGWFQSRTFLGSHWGWSIPCLRALHPVHELHVCREIFVSYHPQNHQHPSTYEFNYHFRGS